jgi:NTE family protein
MMIRFHIQALFLNWFGSISPSPQQNNRRVGKAKRAHTWTMMRLVDTLRFAHPTRMLSTLLLALCVLSPNIGHTQPTPAAPAGETKSRPKIALVLSGGGARGAAHVGVIKVLEELQIPIDFIAGTSMGALIGGSYASGTTIKELEDRLAAADWNDLFTDISPRADRSFLRKEEDQARLLKLEIGVKPDGLRLPAGAISGQKLDILFGQITRNSSGVVNFDKLPIPFRAVATDAETGRMIVFDRGRLPDVMRASMSVPGAIAPFQIGERIYLDGGLTRNLPVDIARQMGADIVIAVSLGTPLLKRSELQSFVGVSLQTINILTEQNVKTSVDSLKQTDVLISPPLDTIGSTDFNSVVDAIVLGAAATRELAPRLRSLAVSPEIYARHRSAQMARTTAPLNPSDPVDEIRVTGLDRASAEEVKRTMGIKPGDKSTEKALNDGLSRVFGSGYFERVNYSLLNEGNRRILDINAREKQWGPDYLRFGLSLAADSVGEGRFNLLVRYQQTQFNSAGAEWRNEVQIGRDRRLASRFFQPFGLGSIANISIGGELSRRPIDIFVGDTRVAQYDVSASVFSADFGVDIGRSAIARLGLVRGNDSAQLSIGSPLLENIKVKQGGVKLLALYDDLNDTSFPREGRVASFDYYKSVKSLYASREFSKLDANYADHYSFGPHTLAFAARYARGFGEKLPVFDQFSLGGFLQLSGYRPGELLGDALAFGRVSYYRRWSEAPAAFGRNVYLGVSGELGRVSSSARTLGDAPNRSSVGLFAGFDTFLGPFYVGYGKARDRGSVFYFFLGQP